ncbi:hypothetical protein DSO57_1030914 [Entomophthora muscae]|uniref:Uncharacterized protein n=1 Tax=Entomophthora muscae TaxID=34485 RepID=A0ACC2RRY7_9FUNG|nr:hypothetical protein DSO57_1030914 [Entomophthora muscae]
MRNPLTLLMLVASDPTVLLVFCVLFIFLSLYLQGHRDSPFVYLCCASEHNTITTWNCRTALHPEVVIPQIAHQTVSLPYAEQLVQPGIEVLHEDNTTEHLTKLLHTVNVSAPLESFQEASPAVRATMATFIKKFKGLSVHQVYKIVEIRKNHQDCT